ncbi:MAG: hypothetical protein ACYDDF_12070 [Thermoplasmatota archaeon]
MVRDTLGVSYLRPLGHRTRELCVNVEALALIENGDMTAISKGVAEILFWRP